jgi:hypothetical protein
MIGPEATAMLASQPLSLSFATLLLSNPYFPLVEAALNISQLIPEATAFWYYVDRN